MQTTHTGSPVASLDNIPAVRALVAVETAEKIANRVFGLLTQESPDLDQAVMLLAALTSETTTATATLVKDQALSDEIARRMRGVYAKARKDAEAYAEEKRAERANQERVDLVSPESMAESMEILRTTFITTCPGGCDWFSPEAEDEQALYRHLMADHGLSHEDAVRDSDLGRGRP